MKYLFFALVLVVLFSGCEHPYDFINAPYTVSQPIIGAVYQDVEITMNYSYTGRESPQLIEFQYTITTTDNTYSLYDKLDYFTGSIDLNYTINVNNEKMIDYGLVITSHKY